MLIITGLRIFNSHALGNYMYSIKERRNLGFEIMSSWIGD